MPAMIIASSAAAAAWGFVKVLNLFSIHASAQAGDSDRLAKQLEKCQDIEQRDGDGRTALQLASEAGHQDCVRLLLAGGALADAADEKGNTPLHLAATGGHKPCVELLLGHGAGLEVACAEQCTPLHNAASGGHKECIIALLSYGADVHAANKMGRTPLHFVAKKGHRDCIEVLLMHGAVIAARDQRGATPLHYAADGGHQKCVELLLASGADVSEKSDFERTPLHYAALRGYLDTVQLLLVKGASVHAKDKKCHTPLDVATDANTREVLLKASQHNANGELTSNLLLTLDEEHQEQVKDLVCVVCRELRLDIKQCDVEGHPVCGECADRLSQCPHRCGSTSFLHDRRSERVLRNLSCACPLQCGWKGVLKDVEQHGQECGKLRVPCGACGLDVETRALQAHITQECEFRTIQCAMCGVVVPNTDMVEHVAVAHIKCPVPQCGYVGSAADMAEHMRYDGLQHTRTLVEQLQAHTTELATMRNDMQRLREEMRQLLCKSTDQQEQCDAGKSLVE